MKINKDESGFSYIDVMIAILILMVGCLALAAAILAGVVRAREAEQHLEAKQIADWTIESIFSARDIEEPGFGWDAVGNVGTNEVNGVMRGIFLAGVQPIRENAGADNIVGTVDDAGNQRQGFQRQITISDLCDPERPSANCVPCDAANPEPNCANPGTYPVMKRRIDVAVTYPVGNLTRSVRLLTEIDRQK